MKTIQRLTLLVLGLLPILSWTAPLPYFAPNRFRNTEIAGGSGDQFFHASVPAPSYGSYLAGTFVAYVDNSTNSYGAIKIVRVKNDGSTYTPSLVNSAVTADAGQPHIVLSGAYSIVCWERGGTIYMARCDALGNPYLGSAWAGYPDGKPIITTTYSKYDLNMVSDGNNGAIIVWREKRGSYYQIYTQRVDVSGYIKWGVNGRLVANNTTYSIYGAKVIPAGSNAAIVAWYDSHGATGYDVYAQRFSGTDSASFALLWGTTGVGVSTPLTSDQWQFNLCSDDSSGVFIAFLTANAVSGSDIYLQRVNVSGTPRIAAGGVVVCNVAGAKDIPDMVGFTGTSYGKQVYLTWADYRSDSLTSRDIYACRVYCSGTTGLFTSSLWGSTTGLPICAATGLQYQPRVTLDSLSADPGVLISWADGRSGTYDLYAARYSYNGAKLSGWTASNGTVISEAPGSQPYSSSQTYRVWRDDGNNGDFTFLWTEYSNGYDLRMQKESEDGLYIDRVAPWAPVLTNRSNANTKTPQFNWTSVSDAYMYYIDVSSSSSFSTLAVSDSTAVNAYTPAIGKLTNGTWYWRVKARDDGDNFGAWTVGNSFRIDTIAPYWYSFSIQNGDTVGTDTPTLSAVMVDYGTIGIDSNSLVMRLDGNAVSYSQEWPQSPQRVSYTPSSGLSTGWHRATWYVHDSVGNGGYADTAAVNFMVDSTLDDLTGPVFSNALPAENSTVNVLRPVISMSVSDPSGINSQSLQFIVNQDSVAAVYYNGQISWTPSYDLLQGRNQVEVTIHDASINSNPRTLNYYFSIDTIAPMAPVYSGSSLVKTTVMSFQADSIESRATVGLYQGSTLLMMNGTGYFQDIPLSEGLNSFLLQQVDSAGNGSVFTSFSVTRDATPPEAPLILTTEIPAYTSLADVLVRGIAERNSYLALYVNGTQRGFQNMTTYDTFGVVLTLNSGNNVISAIQTDSVGNTSPFSTGVTVIRDSLSPLVDSVSPRMNDTLINLKPTLWAAFHDEGGAGLNTDSSRFVLNGEAVAGSWDGISKFSHSVTADLTDKSWNYFKVRTGDQAGNVCVWDSIAFYVDRSSNDNIAPVISLTEPITTQTTALPLIRIVAQDMENGLDEASIMLFLDGVQKTHTYNAALNEITFRPASALTQGVHRCSVYVEDASTNHNSAKTAWSFLLDSDAPGAPQVAGLTTPTRINVVTVSGMVSEPRAAIQVYCNGMPVASGTADASGAFSITPVTLTYGANSILVTAADSLGNTSPYSASVSVFMDNVIPLIVARNPEPGKVIGTRTPVFSIQVSDSSGVGIDPAQFFMDIDGQRVSSSQILFSDNVFSYQNTTIPFSHNQMVQYRVAVGDKAGNVSDTLSSAFTVDTTLQDALPPVFNMPFPVPLTVVNTAQPTLSVLVSDASGIETDSLMLDLDGIRKTPEFLGGQVKYTPTTLLSEGLHRVVVRAMDKSSLKNRDSVIWTFSIDTKAPTRPQLGGVTSPVNVSQIMVSGKVERLAWVVIVRGSDTLGGVRCDSFGNFSKPVVLLEGLNRLSAYAQDTAGNTGALSPAVNVVLDSRLPEVSNIYPADNAVVKSPRPLISGLLSDSGAGVDSARSYLIVLDKVGDTVIGDSSRRHAAVYNPQNGLMTWQTTSDLADQSFYRLFFNVYDLAGNSRTVMTRFTTYFSAEDNEAPQISGMSPTGTVKSRTPEISALVTDNRKLDLVGTVLTVNGVVCAFNYDTLTHKLIYQSSVAMLENVEHTIELTARDTAGNPKVQRWSFYVDATPPAAPVLDTLPQFTKNLLTSVSGRAEAKSTVEIVILGTVSGTAAADDSGRFTATGVSLTEGANIIRARASDAAGNQGFFSLPETLSADTRPPVLLSVSPASGAKVGVSPQISAQVADTGAASGLLASSASIRLDGKVIPSLYSNGTIRSDTSLHLISKSHSIQISISDIAGNAFASSQILFIVDSNYVDNVPPVFSNLLPANNSKSGESKPVISLHVSDAASAIDSSSVKMLINLVPVTGYVFTPATGLLTYTPSTAFSQGLVNVMVVAADVAHNKDTVEWKFQVDLTPPAKPSFFSRGDSLVSSAFVNLAGTVEAGVSLSLYRDSVLMANLPPLASDTFQFVDVAIQKGGNHFHLVAFDDVGNASPISDTLNIVYNTAAPVIGNAGVGSVTAEEDSIFSFQIIASDADGNALHYRFLKPSTPATYGMSLDSNGLFTWNPSIPYTDQAVQIRVDDGFGKSDTILFLATAQPVNDPPVFSGLRDTSITHADTVRLSFSIADEDNASLTAFGVLKAGDPSMQVIHLTGTNYQFRFFADSSFTDSVRLFAYDGQDTARASFRLSVSVEAAATALNFGTASDTLKLRLVSGTDTAALFFPYNTSVSGKTVTMQRLTPGTSDTLGGGIGSVGSLYELSGLDSGFACKFRLPVPAGFNGSVRQLMIFRRASAASPWTALRDIDTTERPRAVCAWLNHFSQYMLGLDTTAPRIRIDSVNAALKVYATITENISNPEMTLHYRTGGAAASVHRQVLITQNGLVQAVDSVPASFVSSSESGVEFWLTITDGLHSVSSPHRSVSRTFEASLPASAVTAGAFRMVSLPFLAGAASPDSVLSALISSDTLAWRIGRWSASDLDRGSYVDHAVGRSSAFLDLKPGSAVWVYTKNAPVGTFHSSRSLTTPLVFTDSTTQGYEVTLVRGWNQIGNPYPFNVKVTDVELDTAKVQRVFYAYDPNSKRYTAVDTLKPFEGYWVLARSPATLLFPSLPPSVTVGKAARDSLGWITELLGGQSGALLRLGEASLAGEGRDAGLDLVGPPAITNGLNLSIPHLDWAEWASSGYIQDIRSAKAAGHVWTVRASRTDGLNHPGSYALTLSGTQVPPLGKKIAALFPAEKLYVDLRSPEGAQLTFAPNENVMDFKVVAGDPDFVDGVLAEAEEIPAATAMDNNAPNPFNPSTRIAYHVKKPGPLTIVVYDLRGRKIVSLVNKYHKSGHFSVTWNGRTAQGATVASGVYLYRMECGGAFTKTRRMVYVR